MACITKLANAIAYDCDTGATGLASALIINKADIASYVVSASALLVGGFTLAAGTSAYKIDTVKRALVVSSALKVNDGAPNGHAHSATITYTYKAGEFWRSTMASFSNGSFVILAKPAGSGSVRVYGLYYGLSATAIDNNSHDNGAWTTITLETPENVIGEDTLCMSTADYDALYAAAVG
jgi:hypothetical protein